jgi:Fe-S-cluster containining protein
MTELEMICKRSGIEVSECDCGICQSMCRQAPCIGTPADIVQLINNGYIHQLETCGYSAGNVIGIETFFSVQIKTDTRGGCPLFKDGKCTIHNIKPTDGKLASCKSLFFNREDKKPTYLHLIAESWNASENLSRIAFIIKSVYKYQSLNLTRNGSTNSINHL